MEQLVDAKRIIPLPVNVGAPSLDALIALIKPENYEFELLLLSQAQLLPARLFQRWRHAAPSGGLVTGLADIKSSACNSPFACAMLNREVHTMHEDSILKIVRATLEHEPLIKLHQWPVSLAMADDHALVMEGDVGSVAAKKLALQLARSIPDVGNVVSHLHVVPTEPKSDGEILELVSAKLLNVGELKNCALRVLKKGQIVTLHEGSAEDASGDILVSVKDAIVALDGWVISLSHKRLTGVLAWWVPGCRDVVDGLEVMPPEQDNDGELNDALSLVLEVDPMIPHPDQIRVRTHDHVVTLEGLVSSYTEKCRAEQDAWCLFDVDRVVNHLAVAR